MSIKSVRVLGACTLTVAVAVLGVGPMPTPVRAATKTVILTNTNVVTPMGWTVPSDWNNDDNTIEIIGAGGRGDNGQPGTSTRGGRGGAGGGGGAYTKVVNVQLSPNAIINYRVGLGAGYGDSWICNTRCSAYTDAAVIGGALGGADAVGTTPGAGGAASGGIPATAVRYSGGTGGAVGTVSGNGGSGGGGGGGAAGRVGDGEAGTASANAGSKATAGGSGGRGDALTGGMGGAGGTVSGGSGAAGGAGTEFDATHGSGGGSGAGAGGNSGSWAGNPGLGGSYGAGSGGGGGAGKGSSLYGGMNYAGHGIIVITYTPVNDTTAPNPNPPTFGLGSWNGTVFMNMSGATDDRYQVRYYYGYQPCAIDNGMGGNDSGWQTSSSYTDAGVEPNKCYAYTAQLRDTSPNLNHTASSTVQQVYSRANAPGTPTLSDVTTGTVTITNDGNGNPTAAPETRYLTEVVVTGGTDLAWHGKLVDASGNPADYALSYSRPFNTAVWLSDAELDGLVIGGGTTPLQPGTTYEIRVKATNQDGQYTSTAAASTTTLSI